MYRPETLVPESTHDLIKQTCLHAVFKSAFENAGVVMGEVKGKKANVIRTLLMGEEEWALDLRGNSPYQGYALRVSDRNTQITYRSRFHNRRGQGYVESTNLLEELRAVRRSAGHVAVYSPNGRPSQPKPEVVTVESMKPVTFPAAFHLIETSSEAILDLSRQAS